MRVEKYRVYTRLWFSPRSSVGYLGLFVSLPTCSVYDSHFVLLLNDPHAKHLQCAGLPTGLALAAATAAAESEDGAPPAARTGASLNELLSRKRRPLLANVPFEEAIEAATEPTDGACFLTLLRSLPHFTIWRPL